jgi:hypothetical protein
MKLKISKLYNVLVVGGVMAAGACKKEEPKQTAAPVAPAPAVQQEPTPTPALPPVAEPPPAPPAVKAEPPKSETSSVLKPIPPVKTVTKAKAKAPEKKTAAAKGDGSDGSGVTGWN